MAGSPDMAFLDNKQRLGFGNRGSALTVITNAYKASPPKKADLHFFDCSISLSDAREGHKIRKDENRRIILDVVSELEASFNMQLPLLAYDDEKTLVLVNIRCPMVVHEKKELVIERKGPMLSNGGNGIQRYIVVLTYTKNIMITEADFRLMDGRDQTPQEVRGIIEKLQALNLLLREAISDTERAQPGKGKIVVSMGDKIYANLTEQMFPRDVGRFRAIWPGFAAAFRVSRCGLVLNTDLTHSVFFNEGYLHDIVCMMMNVPLRRDSKIDPREGLRQSLSTVLRTRLVDFKNCDGEELKNGQLGKIFYRGSKTQFVGNGDETPLFEAYAARNIQLQYPDLPCVEVILGTVVYTIPLEMCFLLSGQRYNKLLNKQEQAVFIRAVSLKPNERIGEIARFMQMSGVRQHPLMTTIGLIIANDFIKIGARILPMPEIEYQQNHLPITVKPMRGQWTMERGVKYQNAAAVQDYLVIIFPGRNGPCVNRETAGRFIQSIGREAECRGMTWGRALEVYSMEQPQERLSAELDDAIRHFKPKFVFGIFDRGMDRQYSDFKLTMDNLFGIPSQGLLAKNVEQPPRGYIENILYKINVKSGGTNNTLTDDTLGSLKMLNRLFMVIGISLSHGRTKEEEAKPSYAGFVGSVDDSFRTWVSEVMVTEANEAVLAQITDKIVNMLRAFKESTKSFPEVLIVYRDGVTRTQESQLHGNDIKCIKEAFRRLDIQVELVFVVVNKMHRQRFFNMPKENSMGEPEYSSENIVPGLVVDDVIVDPYGDDFYLASHRGLLGTSRPIRYHILLNEDSINTEADDIQGLTMSLCYTYQRCTLGVSIPAPLYYANLAAARCAVLADSVIRATDGGSAGRGARGARGGARGRGTRGARGTRGGRGGAAAPPSILADPVMRENLTRGIQQHDFLKRGKRLSFI